MANGLLQPKDFTDKCTITTAALHMFFFFINSYACALEINSEFPESESLSCQNSVDIYLWLQLRNSVQPPATTNTVLLARGK